MKWLHMGVVLSSISSGILAVGDKHNDDIKYLALSFLPMSILIIIYALITFHWRSHLIKTRDTHRWDDPYGPVILTILLFLLLLMNFSSKFLSYLDEEL